MTWQDALKKVADLNASPGSYTCGGYSAAIRTGTPNVNELETLYNAEVTNFAAWQDDQVPSMLEPDGPSGKYRKSWTRLPGLARPIESKAQRQIMNGAPSPLPMYLTAWPS